MIQKPILEEWEQKYPKGEIKVSRKTDRTNKKMQMEEKEKEWMPEFKNGVLEIRLEDVEIG